MPKHKGFTLIELLIVIAIIGILSSVVLVSLSSARDKAKLSKALSSMESINKVMNSCLINGSAPTYPAENGTGGTLICATETATLPNISDTGFIYCGGSCGGWTGDGLTTYAISAYSNSFSGGRKIIACGHNYNFSGWYGVFSWDARGITGCKTYGF